MDGGEGLGGQRNRGEAGERWGGVHRRGREEPSCTLTDQLDTPRDQSCIMPTPQMRPLSTER